MEYLEHLDPNLDRIFYFPRESNTPLGVASEPIKIYHSTGNPV
jgi:hypothetical protein